MSNHDKPKVRYSSWSEQVNLSMECGPIPLARGKHVALLLLGTSPRHPRCHMTSPRTDLVLVMILTMRTLSDYQCYNVCVVTSFSCVGLHGTLNALHCCSLAVMFVLWRFVTLSS